MPESEKSPTILVIDDDDEIRYSLKRVLAARGYTIEEAASGEEGIRMAGRVKPAVILLDNRMEGMSGLEALQHLKAEVPLGMVILMTAYGNTQTAIEAMKFGAFDYVIKPFDLKKIIELAASAMTAFEELDQSEGVYKPLLNSDDYKEGIVGTSEPMQTVFKMIGKVAASDVTVMITGESGTGKELVARALYQHSHRAEKPFIAVNCAAIPENLIESELFGHEKGSFTGATSQRTGKFELSDDGTIFLDEIGDMSLSTQTKILRAIQEGEIQRVGGSETLKVDVRMIAATNKDLEKLVEAGDFREDLYYRLNVVRIRLPALRERKEDIPQLVDFMLQRLAKDRKIRVKSFSAEARGLLVNYEWPGNVRELENVVYRSAVVAKGEAILPKDLPGDVIKAARARSADVIGPAETRAVPGMEVPKTDPVEVGPVNAAAGTEAPALLGVPAEGAPLALSECWDRVYKLLREEGEAALLPRVEEAIIRRVLRETEGNQMKAAGVLGITRGTLRKRIDQYSINPKKID